jgi:TRAP-type mannitol/chloroaromatic compound transport system substrate-binding protein
MLLLRFFQMLNRRNFLNTAALTTTASLVACSQGATSSNSTTAEDSLPRVEWRMATSWPQSLDTIFGGAQTVCDRVREATGGRFDITPFAAGEIVGGLEVMDAVQNGAVECGHTADYYYIGKSAALAFGASVPFGLTAQQQNSWLYSGGGLELIQNIYADFNIINFPAGNTGAQMGGWYKTEIQSVADLNGLKMRIPGLGGKVMAKLGVNVQVLPGGDTFVALDRGAIDAAEWVGPYDDEKLGLHQAAKFYYYPGWWEPGPTLDLLISRAAWDQLPTEYQAILQAAAKEANLSMLAQYDSLNRAALIRLQGEGVQLRTYSPEILAAAQTATQELFAESSAEDETFRTVYEQWEQFRQEVVAWNTINELSFTRFVGPES